MNKTILALVVVVLLGACELVGPVYTFQKIAVNHSDYPVKIISNCCGSEGEEYFIEAGETRIIFQCGWQGGKPSCDEVENDFTVKADKGMVRTDKDLTIQMENHNNWTTSEEGETIMCTFLIENADFK